MTNVVSWHASEEKIVVHSDDYDSTPDLLSCKKYILILALRLLLLKCIWRIQIIYYNFYHIKSIPIGLPFVLEMLHIPLFDAAKKNTTM